MPLKNLCLVQNSSKKISVWCFFCVFLQSKYFGMKRKIYDELLKWKNEEQGSVALLIEGARPLYRIVGL